MPLLFFEIVKQLKAYLLRGILIGRNEAMLEKRYH
jgi:hypothetical protein